MFVWDRAGQSNQLVSVGLDALPARGGASINPLLSADGRYVVFVSGATNLVAADTNNQYDVFLRDLQLQQTTRISVTTNDVSLASYDPPMVAMTPDARFVAFMARTNATVRFIRCSGATCSAARPSWFPAALFPAAIFLSAQMGSA